MNKTKVLLGKCNHNDNCDFAGEKGGGKFSHPLVYQVAMWWRDGLYDIIRKQIKLNGARLKWPLHILIRR